VKSSISGRAGEGELRAELDNIPRRGKQSLSKGKKRVKATAMLGLLRGGGTSTDREGKKKKKNFMTRGEKGGVCRKDGGKK